MIELVDITPSIRPGKRFKAHFLINGKSKYTHFGDATEKTGFHTYIDHGDKARRKAYWLRHHRDFQSGNITRPGYLSALILWGPSNDINKNINTYRHILGNQHI